MWRNEMKTNVDRVGTSEILRTVSPDQLFLFFEDINKYTGRMAANLNDFCEIIKTIDVKSLTFHFGRGDFERWISESLHDVQLARRLKRIKKSNSGELRKEILQAARSRLEELRGKKVHKIKSPYQKEKLKKTPPRKKKTTRNKTKSKTTKTRRKRRKETARL